MAEELLEKNITSGIADLCFVASKHAIQAALAMKGKGYSSKIKILLPLTERYFGKAIAQAVKKLFELYIKSEYSMEFLTEEEIKLAIEYAKKIFEVYQQDNWIRTNHAWTGIKELGGSNRHWLKIGNQVRDKKSSSW